MKSKLSVFFSTLLVSAALGLVTSPTYAYCYYHHGHKHCVKSHYKCKWVGGYWKNGYWHKKHKVCWRHHHHH